MFTFTRVKLTLSHHPLSLLCDREHRKITGDIPPDLSGFCGSHANGKLYIFGGCDPTGYTNQVSYQGENHMLHPCYSLK